MENQYRIIDKIVYMIITKRTVKKIYKFDLKYFNIVKKYNWYISSNGYARCDANNKTIYLHRLLIDTPKNCIVDHIDRDVTNNLISNLRIANKSTNGMNRNIQRNNKSGIIGVYYIKKKNRWAAQININKNKRKCLGTYKEKIYAIKARLKAEWNIMENLHHKKTYMECI